MPWLWKVRSRGKKNAQTRVEAETMVKRNGKEVRISRSGTGIAADEILAKEDEDIVNGDLVNEDEAEAGNNAIAIKELHPSQHK